VSALGTPFVLEGLFGEADAEVMDAEPDLEPATDVMNMDVEGDAEGTAVTPDGGMIIDDDFGAKNNTSIGKSCVFHPYLPRCAVEKFHRIVGTMSLT
jgi:hypothetical protein